MEYDFSVHPTDINDFDRGLDEYNGQYYSFTSPLDEGVFFSIPAEKDIPGYYSPIVDEDEGLCVGYMHKDMSTLYNIYDYNGNFVNRFEPPLKTPWLDPLDLILLGPILVKGLIFGPKIFKLISRGEIVARGSNFIAEHWVAILRGRIKWGLSSNALKFSAAASLHMGEAGRYVPIAILERAIRYGRRLPDFVGKSGKILQRYEIEILRSRAMRKEIDNGNGIKNVIELYENHKYILEVVVDESTWTIVHFLYK